MTRLIRKTASLLPVLLLAISAASLQAAPLNCIFEHYSSDDGLPHNSIADIHQDRQGYIWLCTWYGLSRFDGNSFVNYTMLPGDRTNLSHNRILSIKEDKGGMLWLTTYDYRLYRFDSKKETFVAIPGDIQDRWPADMKVNCFHCAQDGNVWVAFNDAGLMKITPDLKTESYFGTGGIGRNVRSIYEDSDGNIYAVSEAGLSTFSGGTAELISRAVDINGFTEFGGNLYFLTPEKLLVIGKQTRKQTTAGFGGKGRATAISLTGKEHKNLYIGFNDNKIASVDTSSLGLRYRSEKMGRVRYFFPDPEGLLWIATDMTGIWSYNPANDRFRHYEHSRNVMSYYCDTLARAVNGGGQTWIKMNGYGFGYYDRESDSIIPLNNVKEQADCRFMNGVACFDVDESGVLWFSSIRRGLERVTVITPKIETVTPPSATKEPLSAAEVRAMFRDSRDHVWVATKSRELFRYSPDMSSCYRFPGAENFGIVYSIYEDTKGNIWLGSKGDGLTRLTPRGSDYKARQFRHDPSDMNSLSCDNIYSICQDLDGRIWIGTYGGGLSMLETPESESFHTIYKDFPTYPSEYGDRVRYVCCTPEGKMLIATVGGLIWFEPLKDTELITFHFVQKIPGDIHSLGNNDIIHIMNDNDGCTWLCTFGGGLNKIRFEEENARFDIVSTEDGLASNIVLSAVCDKNGDIWVATETGISKIRHSDRNVTNYSKYDGLGSTIFSEATCAALRDGTIAFGSLNNICRIDPEKFVYTPEPKRLAISGTIVDGKRVTAGGNRITIPHDYSFFRIDFASLNFKRQGKTRFAYKLEGYDKKWIESESGSAVFSRIPHGKYSFVVRACSDDDVNDAETASLQIRILPSVWESTPAIIIYILLTLFISFILIRMFLTSMKLKNDIALEQNLNILKARFFTNISHELRTPLTLILGGIDEIGKDTPQGSRNEYSVNMVRRNAKRMMTLVDQLLDIRRIADGKMKIKVRQVDIVRIAHNVYDDFKDMASGRDMELTFTHTSDSLMIWGDAGRLEALIYNLVSNAFKYTANGGRIEIGIYGREAGNNLRIKVKDNGIGIPKEKRTAIFEPFITTDHSSIKGMSSSGIGLSFCKEIVEVHGGKIWVESQIDKGSEFFVILPLGKDHFKEGSAEFIDEDEIMPDEKSGTPGMNKYKVKATYPEGALKVLVVEDNTELCTYLYNCLVNKYEVKDAGNGREALEIIREGWMPDMIVTDLMMPVMDGIEFINIVRNDFNTSHIPIIMITAKHESDTHLKAMRYGADGYIAKPFPMELLMARMENLLERRRTLLSKLSAEKRREDKSSKIEISPDEIVITDKDEELIKKVMEWLEENVENSEVTVDNLATYVGMGRTSMYNKLKGLTGKSPVELIQDFRLEKATQYLRSGQFSVSETSYKVGFSDPGYFSRSFKKHFGISPADYIKEHKKKSSKQ